MRVKCHHTLGILVGTDGHVMVPASKHHKAHWTFGSKNRKGYLCIKINGKQYRVHRIVLEAFAGECPEGFECDHSDRNRRNNTLTNLRWVPRTTNNRNTRANDRVDTRGGTHYYENEKQYRKEWGAKRNKTHKHVLFSDGKQRWVPNSEALELLKLPVKERVYGG